MNSNNEIPQVVTAAQAAANYVNTHLDGIAGHKIDLDVCDEKADPTAASACTPQFVQDGDVAVIGYPLVWIAIGGLQGLAAANIPYLGLGVGAGQSAPNSYPMFGGEVQVLNFATQFKELHIKTVNYISVNFPANVASATGIDKSVWAANGITIKKTVFYTSGAADVTTPSTQAVEGDPDAIYVNCGAGDVARIVAAIRQAGYTGKIFAAYSALTPQLYPAAASIMKGVTVETGQLLYFLDDTNPEVKLMSTILATAGIAPDPWSQTGVAQVFTLANIGDQLGGNLTGARILDYMKTVKDQKVFMGYQMSASQAPQDQPIIAHTYDTFSRFMTYNGHSWSYSTSWVSVFGTAEPGVGAAG